MRKALMIPMLTSGVAAFANPPGTKTAGAPTPPGTKTAGAPTPPVSPVAPMPAAAVTVTGAITLAAPLPQKSSGRGGAGKYPFDSLTAVGMVFGITGKLVKNMNSTIAGANKKFRGQHKRSEAGVPLFETKTNPDGSVVSDTSKPIYEGSRKFVARDVTPEIAVLIAGTALEGSTVLVERII